MVMSEFQGLCKIRQYNTIDDIPWGQFHQGSMRSFYARRSQKRKNSVKTLVSFYDFGIHTRKSCAKNIDEIDTRCYYDLQKI